MRTPFHCASLALLAVAVCAPAAGAQVVTCQRAIAKASAEYLQARVKALSKCEARIVKRGSGSCPNGQATAAIHKARAKMESEIGKSCGGADKACGGNLSGEPTPAALGWPSACPNFEKGDCDQDITDCGDIVGCLTCIDEAASDQAMRLYYDDLALPSSSDKTLNKCQVTIGKATSTFLRSKSTILRKCWDARANGKHGDDCFGGATADGKYQDAIARAAAKVQTKICKACGGPDKECGTMDDLTRAEIGFSATCPAVTQPHGGLACGGPINDALDIADCVECVTEFKVDCADNLQVPQYEPYPAECNVCTQPAPSGPCPSTVSFTPIGPKVDLDVGFTGLAHDGQMPTDGRVTLAVSGCAGVSQPTCGQCNVSGPIDNTGGVALDNHRCRDATWVQCSNDGDCTSATTCSGGANDDASCTNASECPGGSCSNAGVIGPCTYFFGAPLPLRVGGIPMCVLNEIAGPIAGTVNVDDGTTTTALPLSSRIFVAGSEFAPCPRCESGTCQDGSRFGHACTANGTGQFGAVSFDCPASAPLLGPQTINLNLATATQTKTVEVANPTCRQTGFTGLKCLCDTCNDANQESCSTNADCPFSGGGPGICGGRRCIGGTEDGQPCNACIGGPNHGATCANASACPGGTCSNPRVCDGGLNDSANCSANSACPGGACRECAGGGSCNRPGEATQPNSCQDDTSTPGLDCGDIGNNEGECLAGPVDSVCSIQTFRYCSNDADCEPSVTCPECLAGQHCAGIARPCFPDNGIIGNTVTVSGSPDVPCGGASRPTLGAFYCAPPVAAALINASEGLPGLGRVRLPSVLLVDP